MLRMLNPDIVWKHAGLKKKGVTSWDSPALWPGPLAPPSKVCRKRR
jgi:hypothetical protein